VTADAYRRQLQRSYLDLVNAKLNGPAMTVPFLLPPGFPVALFASSGDEKPFYRAELRALSTSIGAALGKTTDRTTRAHLEAARDQIVKILDPKFAAMQGGAGPEIRIFGDNLWSGQLLDDSGQQFQNCWPDYSIKP
jgi:hypothetical protein